MPLQAIFMLMRRNTTLVGSDFQSADKARRWKIRPSTPIRSLNGVWRIAPRRETAKDAKPFSP